MSPIAPYLVVLPRAPLSVKPMPSSSAALVGAADDRSPNNLPQTPDRLPHPSLLSSIMTTFCAPATSDYLTREQAASYIQSRIGVPMTASKLASRAHEGNGPPYKMWGGSPGARGGRGRVAIYRACDLDTWIASMFSDPAPYDQTSSPC